MRTGQLVLVAALTGAPFAGGPAIGLCAGRQDAEAPSSDEKRFETLAQRYWKILLKHPRRGTALDLWYRHYLDRGKLDELLTTVRRHAKENAGDSAAQLLLGLVLERRGLSCSTCTSNWAGSGSVKGKRPKH